MQQWTTFLAVAEQKSFIKAARVLNVSQSAVSHTIANLEKECGSYLFIRNRNNTELTSNGIRLLPLVRQMVSASDLLEKELDKIKNRTVGEVRIAAFNSVSLLWLPDIVRQFQEKYPDIKVYVRQCGDAEIRRLIDEEKVDLAINSRLAVDPDMMFIPLHQTPMVCVASEDFVPENGKAVTETDLKKQPIIFNVEGYETEMKLYMEAVDLSDDFQYRVEVDDTAYAFAEQGLGLHVTPLMATKPHPRNISIWELDPQCTRTVGIVTTHPRYITPAAKLLREKIVSYVNENGYMNI